MSIINKLLGGLKIDINSLVDNISTTKEEKLQRLENTSYYIKKECVEVVSNISTLEPCLVTLST